MYQFFRTFKLLLSTLSPFSCLFHFFQCDQMAKLLFKIWPFSTIIICLITWKCCQRELKLCQIALKIAKDILQFAKVAKFCQIWSHWICVVVIIVFLLIFGCKCYDANGTFVSNDISSSCLHFQTVWLPFAFYRHSFELN